MLKQVGPATLELSERGAVTQLKATVRGETRSWEGAAFFNKKVREEAYFQFDRIHTPTDLEDLVRSWMDKDAWDSYQLFRNAEGF
jgi:hypothetical protein